MYYRSKTILFTPYNQLGALSLTPKILAGAADIYKFVGNSPIADETPETIDRSRTLEKLIQILAEYIE